LEGWHDTLGKRQEAIQAINLKFHYKLQSNNSVDKMELVQRFEKCMKRQNTVKKEFQWMGLSQKILRESLKKLEEETAFAGMMNWIINQMPQEESVEVRFRTENQIYQVTLYYNKRKLRARCLEVIAENDAGFILYDWEEETNYDNLTTEKIRQSVSHADDKNQQKHNQVMNYDHATKDFPDKSLEITEEDLELIDEFLKRSLLHKMISTYFYCWRVEDVPSFQFPLVGPCLQTHTELQKGLILKPEPGPSPKSQA